MSPVASPPLRAAILNRPRGALVRLALALGGLAALFSFVADAPRGAAQGLGLGEENSWIRVQNLGINPATVSLSFFDRDGAKVAVDGCPSEGRCDVLPGGSGWSFFQQGLEDLEEGYRGAAQVTVDQPFVALLARDVFKDGAFQIAGDLLRVAGGGATQYAPLVQHSEGYVSRLSVQNTSDNAPACVELRYYAEGALTPAAVDPPGPTPGCPDGGHLLAPRATLLRDEQSLPLPPDFSGAAVVHARDTASGVAAESQALSMTVDTRDRTAPGLATYRALDRDEMSRVVVLPLVDRSVTQGQTEWTTRFRIMNGDPTTPNEVTLLFEGTDGAGDRVEIEHTVSVRSSLTCDQARSGKAACLPQGESLPDPFFGTVRLQALEPVAVVVQRLSEGGALADYRGFSPADASRNVVLPVLNKNFGPWGGHSGWNSWFRVLTFDGSVAHVRVIYYSRQFETGLLSPPLTVDRQRTFRQWENRRLPDGWVGSAIVVADRPIVVVVNLESDVFEGDPVMLYNGEGVD